MLAMYYSSDSVSSTAQSAYRNYRNSYEPDIVLNLFNKKFRLHETVRWGEDNFPAPDLIFHSQPWKINALEKLKNRLNINKSKLNDFNLEEWSSHTRRRNPAGEVCWNVRNLVNPEFLTQAWTKFYECASSYKIIPRDAVQKRQMVSLHLCEAPGAFITSLNHYLKTNFEGINWQWLASTLNPYYEGNSLSNMINDDRFMFHTLENWEFGADNTGNLMNWDNSQAVIKRAKSLGKVLLVTADGSIDCLQKPDAQEEVTSPLHYCEIVTALQALSTGGTLIFKLFTMFEHSTVNLLYLVHHLFKEVNIYKPATSRQGNSEVYAVCLNYTGSKILDPYLPKLKSGFGTEIYHTRSLFPLQVIPESFLKQIEMCANYFSSIQCQVIDNNLEAYLMQNNIALHKNVKRIRALVASEYIRIYGLRCLNYDQEILKGALHEEYKMNMNPRYPQGSYTERQLFSKISLKEKASCLKSYLNADVLSNPLIFITDDISWFSFYDANYDLKVKLTHGYPVNRVNSSKFIFVPIFKLHQQIMDEEDFKDIIMRNGTYIYRSKLKQDVKPEAKTYLILSKYEYNGAYSDYEKDSFMTLSNKLKELPNGSTICVENFNLLTHFNVSVLFILSKLCFEKVGFAKDGTIYLQNLLNKDRMLVYLSLVEEACTKVKFDDRRDVLSCLPMQITNSGHFFSSVVFFNNTLYCNRCKEYLELILSV